MSKPKNFDIPKALRLKALGYQFMPLICLALLVLSIWEFSVRIDAMRGPFSMMFDMARGEGIPISRVLQYFEWNMLEPLIYLICSMVTALVSLFCFRRPVGSIVMMPVCAVLGVYGLLHTAGVLQGIWNLVPGVLLLTMAAFGMLNLSTYRVRQRNLIMNLQIVSSQIADTALPDAEFSQAESVQKPVQQPTGKPIRKKKTRSADDLSDSPRLTDAPRLRHLAQAHSSESEIRLTEEASSVDSQSA